MATEPDDIVLESSEPANDDRTQEVVSGHRSDFEAVPSIAQALKKSAGQCRMVVEYPFEFERTFLVREGKKLQGRPFIDGVEYLRVLQQRAENGEMNEADLKRISLKHSENGIRWTAAK